MNYFHGIGRRWLCKIARLHNRGLNRAVTLALRAIEDYEFVESSCVTDIDIHDPIVEIICLLSEEIDLVVRDIAPEYETAPLARQIDAA